MVRHVQDRRRTPRAAIAVAVALAGAAAGCGEDFANAPGPPPQITVSAVISPAGVSVSPSRLRAGTIELIASNQTATSQRLTVQSTRGGGRRLRQATGPINPGDTASLKATLAAGSYLVSAGSPAIEPTTIVVSEPRTGNRDRLLQP
jgi:hypothetical protein